MSSIKTNNSFKSPIIGIDPITRGTFVIEWAYMLWIDPLEDDYEKDYLSNARGKIVITSENNNPLFKLAIESPLRLQGLVASVDFSGEKRFIRIDKIEEYIIFPSMNGIDEITLNPVTFQILDSLEYLEAVNEYKDFNLL